MGSSTKIDQVTALVSGNLTTISNLAGDKRNLEWVVAEEFEGLSFGQDQTVESLSLCNNLFGSIFNLLVVFIVEHL